MDSVRKKNSSKKPKAWERNSTNYSCDNLIKYKSYNASLEAYIFKSRGVLKDTDELEQAFEEDTQGRNGIYFLYSSDKSKVYVGKTEESYKRIVGHNNTKSERYYNDWDEAILFITKDDNMSPTERDNLESIFIQIFKNSVEDTISLNRKDEKLRFNHMDSDKLVILVDAIVEKLKEIKLLDKNAQVDIGESTDVDINSLIQEASIQLKNEIKESQDSKVIFLDKLLKYEDLREKVSHANNLIFRNRILSSILNRKALDEVITPREIAEKMVNSLPNEVFDGKHTFFDPACKSGIFLQLILEKLMSDDENLPINHNPDFKDRQNRLKDIIDKLIFGVALSPSGLCVVQHTLFETIDILQNEIEASGRRLKTIDKVTTIPHIICLDDYKIKLRDRDLSKKIEKAFETAGIIFEKQGEEMKFDVVIGNPPYQEEDGGNGTSSSAIYHKFIDLALDISNQYSTMIVPSRWMSDLPRGINNEWLSKFRQNDKIESIVDYADSKDIFTGVNIAGGVCYFSINDKHTGDTERKYISNGREYAATEKLCIRDDIIVRDLKASGIIAKISCKNTLDSLISSKTPFQKQRGTRVPFDTSWEGFSIQADDTNYIKYYSKKAIGGYGYVSKDLIEKGLEMVPLPKLLLQTSAPTDDTVLNLPVYAGINSTCASSWAVLCHPEILKTEEMCLNCIKYIKTKFLRFLVKSIKSTQHATKEVYKLVPIQDFSNNSDINWNLSVAEIDQQLYGKYKLTEEEISYIESTIKPMV